MSDGARMPDCFQPTPEYQASLLARISAAEEAERRHAAAALLAEIGRLLLRHRNDKLRAAATYEAILAAFEEREHAAVHGETAREVDPPDQSQPTPSPF